MPLYIPPIVVVGRAKAGGTTHYMVPGVELSATGTVAIAANVLRYEPFITNTTITIDQLALEVTTASAGGTTLRMGIYNADTDWQPTSLIVDAGTVAADSLGVKTASISQTLSPGRYLKVINSDSTPTLRTGRGGSALLGAQSTLTSAPFFTPSVATAYAAFTAAGVAWTTLITSGSPPVHYVFCRVSVP